jgi:hypothetical protein
VSADFANFATVAKWNWPGWEDVQVFRREDRLVVQLSVNEKRLEQYMSGSPARSAALDKLMKGAGVQELVRQVLVHQQNSGLKRYGRKGKRR